MQPTDRATPPKHQEPAGGEQTCRPTRKEGPRRGVQTRDNKTKHKETRNSQNNTAERETGRNPQARDSFDHQQPRSSNCACRRAEKKGQPGSFPYFLPFLLCDRAVAAMVGGFCSRVRSFHSAARFKTPKTGFRQRNERTWEQKPPTIAATPRSHGRKGRKEGMPTRRATRRTSQQEGEGKSRQNFPP